MELRPRLPCVAVLTSHRCLSPMRGPGRGRVSVGGRWAHGAVRCQARVNRAPCVNLEHLGTALADGAQKAAPKTSHAVSESAQPSPERACSLKRAFH